MPVMTALRSFLSTSPVRIPKIMTLKLLSENVVVASWNAGIGSMFCDLCDIFPTVDFFRRSVSYKT